MKDIIEFWGLDCETCEARKATINRVDELVTVKDSISDLG